MFSEPVIAAICSIVKSDSLASLEEKEHLSAVIMAEIRGDGRGIDCVVSFAEAAKTLGCKNAQTARNLAKKGKLKSVYGTGSVRAIGVTRSSLDAYVRDGGVISKPLAQTQSL